ncbi:MAG: biotin/lipoyl-containing protein [Bacillota bacterium]
MKKQLRITVDGEEFEVTVEEIGSESGGSAGPKPKTERAAPRPQTAPSPEPKPEPAAAPKTEPASGGAGSEKVLAPLAGTIRQIMVEVGQDVSSGDTLLTLEALKLENEIVAPTGGKIASVDVQIGENVESGAVLVTIEPS